LIRKHRRFIVRRIELLTLHLRAVSRSFYTTLRILPASIRPQISLAYLLARTTDTIADTQLVPTEQRLKSLQLLRERIQGAHATPLDFGELARHQGSAAERLLLEKCEASLRLLESFPPGDIQLIRQVLGIIVSGQELDLGRFALASRETVVALQNDAELDDYTYRVAGCVGEFWTRLCRAHLFPRAALDDAWLLTQGVRFGKGLQMVNILRDLPADLRQGRCYLPAERLGAHGLQPKDLLNAENEPPLRPLYDRYLNLADEHLQAGWSYTNALPWTSFRARLACAWPILIGLETTRLLRTGNVLDAEKRLKISRGQVKRLMCRSVLLYPWPKAWNGMVA
jgi:farnesyl-diphosphate farnesyltransferase